MQTPIRINFRNLDRSDAIEERILQRANDLERFHAQIIGCKVTVASEAHHHQHSGRSYHVRIDLALPGHEIVVERDRNEHKPFEDLAQAVSDAFGTAQRQLIDYSKRSKTLGKAQVRQDEFDASASARPD